jgi:hypothetical protein
MSRGAASNPLRSIAHERAILESWIEDDGVYVTLEDPQADPAISAPVAAFAPGDSRAPVASPLPPTLQR